MDERRMGIWIARGAAVASGTVVTSTATGRSKARFQPVMRGSAVKRKSLEITSGGGGGCQ